MPDLSIVIPTFERQESLHRLLSALARQTYPCERFEVLVVDDGSRDGTLASLEALAVPYRLRSLAQAHAGPGAARNLGVASADSPLVVFLDDDVVPDAGLLAAHVRAHAAHAASVVVGPMLPPPRWRRPSWIRWEEEQLVAQYDAMRRGAYPCTPRQFFTANASLERDRFLASGGFDVRFARAEDVELGYRLRDAGLRFVFDAEARVWHYPRRSFASWRRTPYQYGRGDVAMHRDKGHEALVLAYQEFHGRHPLNRALARACIGRPALFAAVTLGLRAAVAVADRVGPRRAGRAALSALFNLLYWQGIADEIGGRDAVWRPLAMSAGA